LREIANGHWSCPPTPPNEYEPLHRQAHTCLATCDTREVIRARYSAIQRIDIAGRVAPFYEAGGGGGTVSHVVGLYCRGGHSV